jgi:hypothetical protein
MITIILIRKIIVTPILSRPLFHRCDTAACTHSDPYRAFCFPPLGLLPVHENSFQRSFSRVRTHRLVQTPTPTRHRARSPRRAVYREGWIVGHLRRRLRRQRPATWHCPACLVRGYGFRGSLVRRLSPEEDKGKIGFGDGNGDPSWSGRKGHGASELELARENVRSMGGGGWWRRVAD